MTRIAVPPMWSSVVRWSARRDLKSANYLASHCVPVGDGPGLTDDRLLWFAYAFDACGGRQTDDRRSFGILETWRRACKGGFSTKVRGADRRCDGVRRAPAPRNHGSQRDAGRKIMQTKAETPIRITSGPVNKKPKVKLV